MSASHSTSLDSKKATTAANLDALSGQGEFHASKPRDLPGTTKGVCSPFPLFHLH